MAQNFGAGRALMRAYFGVLLTEGLGVLRTEGFYECKANTGGRMQPCHVSFGQGSVMCMAGLYDVWAGARRGR